MNKVNVFALQNGATYQCVAMNNFKNPNADKCFWKIVGAIGLGAISLYFYKKKNKDDEKKTITLRDDADRRKQKAEEAEANKPENKAKREAEKMENRVCEILGLRQIHYSKETSFLAPDVMDKTPVFLIKDFLRQDERGVIYSGTGVGKSILATQIGIALALGHDVAFLPKGTTVTEPTNVFYFDAEMENFDIAARYDGLRDVLMPDEIGLLNRNFIRLYGSSYPTIYYFLNELIERTDGLNQNSVFIIDNLTKIVPGTLTANITQDYYNGIHAIQRRTAKRGIKLTFITVNHTTKDKDVMMGSGNLSNFATSVLQISEVEGSSTMRRISSEKRRWGEKNSFLVQLTNVPYAHFQLVSDAQSDLAPMVTECDIPAEQDTKKVKKHTGGRKPLTQEQDEKIRSMSADEKNTNREIAKVVGTSEVTVGRKIKEFRSQKISSEH